MEFWGVEVKPGETVKCTIDDNRYLHLSQASLGELKSKGNENVLIYVQVNGQKLVLGTLSTEKCPQISFDLVFEKEFELYHNSKSVSIHFCGYKSTAPEEEYERYGSLGVELEPKDVPVVQNANGKPIVKQDEGKPGPAKANAMKENDSAAKKAKKAEPATADQPMVEEDDDDDDDDDDDSEDEEDSEEESEDDEDMVGAMNDSDDEDEDESSDEDEEETPKKAVTGKRPAESTSKTPAPAPEKKAKFTTPAGQKTGNDGKKGGHTATPHPAKQAGKAPANSDKSKQQTPKSTGSVVCKSCSRTFNSENALQSHTKAKHGGT